MATYTENYNLILPEEDDFYNVEDFNENFRSMDTALSTVEAALESIDQKLDQMAGKSSSAVKSIQTIITTDFNTNNANLTESIQTVEPSRCIVIADKLMDSTGGSAKFSYTLSANNITVSCSGPSGYGKMMFQIVEFY